MAASENKISRVTRSRQEAQANGFARGNGGFSWHGLLRDFGQIERQVQIVIRKGVILLGVQGFQQGRRRIPAKVGAQLVDLIHHKDWIVGAACFEALDDTTGHGADVGSPMAPNLGFVADAA